MTSKSVVKLAEKQISVASVLDSAVKLGDELESCVVMGWMKGPDGAMYFGSTLHGHQTLWLLEQLKLVLLGEFD